jgi:hypothetical protein
MRYGLDGLIFEYRQGQEIFLFPQTFRPTLGPIQPPIQWTPGSFSGVKRPGHEVNHSHPSNSEVKNEWIYTSNSLIRFNGVDGKNFTFFFCLLQFPKFPKSPHSVDAVYLRSV